MRWWGNKFEGQSIIIISGCGGRQLSKLYLSLEMGGGNGLKSHMSREKNLIKKASEKAGLYLFAFFYFLLFFLLVMYFFINFI
jgi:hypothetical protein